MAPPRTYLYKKQAEKALRPGQKVYYRNGRYVVAGTPPALPARPLTMGSVLAKLGTTFLTPAQQRAQATQIANQTIGTSSRELKAAQEAAEAEAKAAALATTRFGQAAASIGTGDAEAIRKAYMAAAQQQGGLGAGLSGEARAAQERAAAVQNAALEQLGVKGTVAAAPAGAEVAGYVGGVLPSSELSTLGATSYAGALARRQAFANRGAQDAGLLEYRGTVESNRQLAKQLADLEAKRPEVVRQALESVSGQNRENIATVLAALQLQNTQYETAAGVAQNAAELKANVAAEQAENARLAREAKVDELAARGFAPNGRTLLPGFYRAPNGTVQKVPSWASVNKGGKLVVKPGATRGAAGNPKPADFATARESMFDAIRARLLFDEKTGRPKARDWKMFRDSKPEHIANYLMKHIGSDFVAGFGNKARIQLMANQVAHTIWNQLQGYKGAAAAPSAKDTGKAKVLG